ncbi:MAG: glutamate--tRNA ligase [Bifidobacteriaceae bacterium]|jgi:glutamyl-tRNA synthetase|nr:glutamate--tRNA ligase [Bifidobacteriaceae bacterium]
MTTTALKPARLRVAPSPTGDPHVGTAYMSLFNLAYARQTGGQFILRIEDTDRVRYVADSERQIFDTLHWLGLDWDEGPDVGGPCGPYRQSERLDTYQPYVDQLIADGHAYYCWCSRERLQALREEQERSKTSNTGYDRLCYGKTREERAALPGFTDSPVVRMLIPDGLDLTFPDVIRGQLTAPPPDDQVILKADGFPTYHLAVVVDDHLMGITHVVRGEEWISSTPKHILLYQWLGWEPPAFAHMPLLRNQDRSKISKRKNPAARLAWFREQGYLPEALRNFLQLMGYPPVHGDDEVASFEDFVAAFDWAKINPVGPIFDLDKLTWLNGHYIRSLEPAELAQRITTHLVETGQWPSPPDPAAVDLLTRATPMIQERLTLLSEALPKLAFLYTADSDLVVADDALATLNADAPRVLAAAIDIVHQVPAGSFTAETLEAALRAGLVEGLELKARVAFGAVRTAIAGQKVSPPLFDSMAVLGQASCLARLRALAGRLATQG